MLTDVNPWWPLTTPSHQTAHLDFHPPLSHMSTATARRKAAMQTMLVR